MMQSCNPCSTDSSAYLNIMIEVRALHSIACVAGLTRRAVIQGCCHGELERIYASVLEVERRRGVKVDLLICCGDFQALRNEDDYEALAVPPKCARARRRAPSPRALDRSRERAARAVLRYRTMASFHRYYSGASRAHFAQRNVQTPTKKIIDVRHEINA